MPLDELAALLNDRLEGWELAELLEISSEDLCYAFEDLILERMADLTDFLGLEANDTEEDQDSE